MKNGLLFLLAVLILVPSGPKGKFQVCGPKKSDIGSFTYQKDSAVVFQFRYVNVGDSLLTVTEIVPGCTCMDVSWTTQPLAPGDMGSIRVLYHPGHIGHFKNILTVINDGFPEWDYLYVEGTAVNEAKNNEETNAIY